MQGDNEYLPLRAMITENENSVVPPSTLLLIFCVCMGAAYLLIPGERELFLRLFQDGKSTRAVELVHQAKTAEETQRLKTELAEAALLSDTLDGIVGDVHLFESRLDTWQNRTPGQPELDRMDKIIRAYGDVGEIFSIVRSRTRQLTPEAYHALSRMLGAQALAADNPYLAARIFNTLLACGGQLSPETARLMTTAFRFASQPEQALMAIKACATDTVSLPDDLRELRITLLLEVNRPGEAFDLLKTDFAQASDRKVRSSIIRSMAACATLANRTTELLPLYKSFLSNYPADSMRIEELLIAGRRDSGRSVGIDEDYIHAAKLVARTSEWNDDAQTACTYAMKLAVLGDREELKRCAELNEDHENDADMLRLLGLLVPVPGDGTYTLMLAQLLGEQGDFPQAEKYYTLFLAGNPGRGDVLLELGALHEETNDLAEALACYKQAVKAEPSNMAARMRAASLLIARASYDEALALYRTIPENQHNDQSLENYQMLAESLGRNDDLNRAMVAAFHHQKAPGPADYIDLAESYNMLGNTRRETEVLQQGLQALPESQSLALMLADALYRTDRLDEAALVLSRTRLRENMQAMALFIELCGNTENYALAERFIPEGIEQTFSFPPGIRIELGNFYDATGRIDAAQRLFASVPEGADTWEFLASAKFHEGDLTKAEEFQTKYINATAAPEHMDWVFLGDIYTARGKTQEAAQAYERSLHLIKQEIGSRL